MKALLFFTVVANLAGNGVSGQNYKVRLSGEQTPYAGRVEVYYSGEWMRLCNSLSFTDVSAICRQLKFGSVQNHSTVSSNVSGDSLEVYCSSGSSTIFLSNCRLTRQTNCPGGSQQYLHCAKPGVESDGEVRLVGGNTQYEGHVEVHYNGQWLRLCAGYQLYSYAAAVVCKQLDFGSVSRLAKGYRRYDIAVSVSCNGEENTLTECTISYNDGSCGSGYTQYIACTKSDSIVWTILIPLVCGLTLLCALCIPCCVAYKLYGKKNTVPTTIMAPQPSGRVVRFVNAQAEEVRIEGNVPACEEMRINTRPHTMRQDEENESTSDQPGVTVSLADTVTSRDDSNSDTRAELIPNPAYGEMNDEGSMEEQDEIYILPESLHGLNVNDGGSTSRQGRKPVHPQSHVNAANRARTAGEVDLYI